MRRYLTGIAAIFFGGGAVALKGGEQLKTAE
jgi:hypothetical protein